jgi:hypothetical protein
MAPFTPDANIGPVNMQPTKEARIRIMPGHESMEGWLAVDVPTSSDSGDVSAEFQRFRLALGENPINTMRKWQEESEKASMDFWSKSRDGSFST